MKIIKSITDKNNQIKKGATNKQIKALLNYSINKYNKTNTNKIKNA